MTLRSARLILPFAAFLSVGCGTAHNINPSKQGIIWGSWEDDQPKTTSVFGGVRGDWAGATRMKGQDEFANGYRIFIAPFFVADLPLSLVGDVVTLPYTVAYTLFNQRHASPKATEESKPPQPTPGNAFDSLAGNKFTHPSQRTHGFIEMPLATKTPNEPLSIVPAP